MRNIKHLLFSPSIALMNKLGYRKKFLLLGLLALLTISMVTLGLYFSLSKVIRTSERELQGIALIKPVSTIIQLAQKHRGLSSGFLEGNMSMLDEISRKGKNIDDILGQVEEKLPGKLSSGKDWKNIKADWIRLKEEGLRLTTKQNFADHTDLIQRLQIFEESIADRFALTLDSELDSYYLIDTVLTKLPDVLEHLGQLRALGTGVLAKKHSTELERIQINSTITEASNALKWLQANLSKSTNYNPELLAAAESSSKGINDATQRFITLAQKDVLAGQYATSPDEFFLLASNTLDVGYREMHDSLLPLAQSIIQKRLDRARIELYLAISIALACMLVLSYFLMGIYYSIIRSVQALDNSARAFAGGNLLERAHLDTRDELSQIAGSFNRMADGFNALLTRYAEANELKQKTISSSLVGIVAYHAGSGQCVLSNNAAAVIVGGTEKQLLQQNFRQIASWKDSGLVHAAEEVLKTGAEKQMETQVFSTFGKELWLNALMTPFVTNGEQHLLLMFEDISERKHAESILRYMVEGTTLAVGEKFFGAFVECLAKAIGCRFAILAEMDGADTHTARTIALWADGALVGNFTYDVRDTPCEFVVRNANNKELIVYPNNVASLFPKDAWLKNSNVESYIGIPLFNPAGDYLGHMVVMDGKPFENVETVSSILKIFASRAAGEMERKQVEGKLRNAIVAADSANKAKGDFLASMSHEIRTPMNAIIGLSQLCLQTDLTARQLDYLQKIQGASKSLLGIINDVLDISKIEAGKLELEEAPFYLDSVMQNLATISCVKAQEKGLECSIEIMPDVPEQLIGDPLRISQVLINLTGNAVKFTEKGEITIRVETEETGSECVILRFTVQDTGIGLTQEQISKLFQSFTQADITTSRKFGGTGLGLSISKRLIDLMKGKIWVESMPFAGSKFIFTAQFLKPAQQIGKSYAPEASLHGMRTLLVESNATSCGITHSLLHSFGFEVTDVDNASAVLEALQRAETQGTPYGLVVTGCKMPGADCVELAQKIRKTEGFSSIPKILLLSTYCPDSHILQTSVERGMVDGILPKPVLKKGLFDAITGIFDRASSHEKRSAPAGLFELSHAAAISGAHLLLVEDNEINQQIAQELLEKAGVTVTIAENGEEALSRLLEENFDGVLMDTQMPVMDGLTATRELRKNQKFNNLPVIAITADALSSDLDKCLGAGMNDCIIKPLDSHKMMATLARWIIPSRSIILPAVQPQPQLAETIPDLPGVNVTKGLSRVGGSVSSYYAILEKFCAGQRNTVTAIHEALGASDWKKAERLAHTLKGLAGTIGAERLQIMATELEKYIHELGLTQINMLIPAIEADLSSLIATLENALLSRPEETSPITLGGAEPIHHEELVELIRKLRIQLEKFDSRAEESIAKIRKIAGDAPALHDALALIQQCIKNYDYEQGLEKLTSLEVKVGASI